MFDRYFVLYVCIFYVYVVVGVCQTLNTSLFESATAGLAARFDNLKRYGLGVDTIEDEFANARFEYSHFDIDNTLSQLNAQEAINSVLTTFDDIMSSTRDDGVYSSNCCSSIRDSSQPCCYNCETEDAVLTSIAAEIASSDLDWAEFSVGLADGTLLRYPLPVNQSCEDLDSRLMPWYVSATISSTREIVILLDLKQDDLSGDSSVDRLSKAAISIINSLSETDRVGLVIVSDIRQHSCGNTAFATETVKNELIRVIEEVFVSESANYGSAFMQARNFFSDVVSNQMLILLTDGRRSFSCDEIGCLTSLRHLVYYVNDPLEDILPSDLSNVIAQSVDDIGNYSSLFNASKDTPSDKLMCTSSLDSNGEPSLSLSMSWQNNSSELVGVLNVLLPWNRLLSDVFEELEPRPSSYLFALTKNSTVLYHDSFPDKIVTDVNLDKLEVASSSIKSALAMGNNITQNANKSYYVPMDVPGSLSFIIRTIPVTYSCSRFATLPVNCPELYVCVVVAEEDMRIVTTISDDIDVEGIYAADSQRLPFYHTDQVLDGLCKEYCYRSIRNRLGLQLTYPIELPNNFDSSTISEYIENTRARPSFIPAESKLSEMVALASVAAVAWTADDEQSVNQSIPINKRHLALSVGAYLSFPFVPLNALFTPQYTNWYRSAMAFENKLTFSAVDETPTGATAVYHASTTIKNRFDEVVGVVAAEVTEESLLIDIDNALGGLCSEDYICTVINSNGLFVLRPPRSATPSYLGQESEYIGVLRDLLHHGIVTKKACDDLGSDIHFHVFYQVESDLYNAQCFAGTGGNADCRHTCIQYINNTDSFLLVFKDTCTDAIALCNEICPTSCPVFNADSPECQCSCPEDRCQNTPISFDACSASLPPHNYEVDPTAVFNVRQRPFCHNRSECCNYQQDNCQSSPSCSWCNDEDRCVPLGVCCDGTTQCCSATSLPSCYEDACIDDQRTCPNVTASPTPTSAEPFNTTRAAIIGGVLGGLFALVLIALLVVCFVWYQFFRSPDAPDDKAKGSYMFDDVRVATSNKTAIELKEVEAGNNGVGNGNEFKG